MQPTAGTVSQTKSHRRCSCGWLEPVRRFVFEEISNKDEISSSCSPSSSDPAAHSLMKCQDDWTCSCVTVVLQSRPPAETDMLSRLDSVRIRGQGVTNKAKKGLFLLLSCNCHVITVMIRNLLSAQSETEMRPSRNPSVSKTNVLHCNTGHKNKSS